MPRDVAARRLVGSDITRITLMTHVTRIDRQQPSNQVENSKNTFTTKCGGKFNPGRTGILDPSPALVSSRAVCNKQFH